jgi:uncharacterized membrane protein YcaP (DUF421 family)
MDIVIRAAVVFVLILLLTRVVGRRELGSMEPFDLILLVVIGDLIQQGVTQQDNSLTGAALAITTIALLTVFVAFLSARSRRLRRVFEGAPIVLVSDGEIVESNLRRERLTVEELAAEARLQQVSSLDDVRFAVLETSGKISVIPKAGG